MHPLTSIHMRAPLNSAFCYVLGLFSAYEFTAVLKHFAQALKSILSCGSLMFFALVSLLFEAKT